MALEGIKLKEEEKVSFCRKYFILIYFVAGAHNCVILFAAVLLSHKLSSFDCR
jgi:hypothetical protein